MKETMQQDKIEQSLKAFKNLLLDPEQTKFTALSNAVSCDWCEELLSRKLPCNHNLCENCIKLNLTDDFVFTCPSCKIKLKGVAESNGFFVMSLHLDNATIATEIRVFSDGLFLNFQFLSDFANESKADKSKGNLLLKYFSVLKNLGALHSEVPSIYKKQVFLYSFPVSVAEQLKDQYKKTEECMNLINLCKQLEFNLITKTILANNNGRTNESIIITRSFAEHKNVRFNFGDNLFLITKLLRIFCQSEFGDLLSGSNVLLSPKRLTTISKGYGTQGIEPLPANAELPLKGVNSGLTSYKALAGSLFQGPCNKFEEELMNKQKYKDFKHPMFNLNNDLINQAKEIAGSLTTKQSVSSVDPLPKCDNFSFDLYQHIKCNRYRHCAICCPDAKKEKVVYCCSVSELTEIEQRTIAAYKCIDCKKYLCPACANKHKTEKMDHKYQFKVDRKDYETIKRQNQTEVIKTMHNLIKEKVKSVLEKVNNDVFEYLKSYIEVTEGKYSANN